MDTLTANNWQRDEQRFIDRNPVLRRCAALIREANRRALDADGLHTLLRLLKAMWAATCDLAPLEAAPIAHLIAYTLARHAIVTALLATIQAQPTGSDGPVLTQAALDALARIEACDPVVAPTSTRVVDLIFVLDNLSWRYT